MRNAVGDWRMPAPASWWESLVSPGIICLCVPAHKQGQINFRPIPIYYYLGDPDSAALVVLMAQLQDNCRSVWHIKNRNFHSTHGNSCPSYALRLIAKSIFPLSSHTKHAVISSTCSREYTYGTKTTESLLSCLLCSTNRRKASLLVI